MFAVCLLYMAFIMLRCVLSMPAFQRIFYHKWMLTFVKGFPASIEIILWFLFFNLLMWCITLFDLQILKNPCIPGIKPTWSWCMNFLICCWILFARSFWGFLHLCSSVILACSFLFLWHLCLVLVLGWCWPHRMSLAVLLSSAVFLTSLSRIGVSSSLNFW